MQYYKQREYLIKRIKLHLFATNKNEAHHFRPKSAGISPHSLVFHLIMGVL